MHEIHRSSIFIMGKVKIPNKNDERRTYMHGLLGLHRINNKAEIPETGSEKSTLLRDGTNLSSKRKNQQRDRTLFTLQIK